MRAIDADELKKKAFGKRGGLIHTADIDAMPTIESEQKQVQIGNDPVNHPSHYTQGKVECIDAMEMVFGKDAVINFAICNCWKYLWRMNDKGNRNQDIEKAIWYFNKAKELINK